MNYLTNYRNSVLCVFSRDIETQVGVWENEKCCGNTSQQASISTAFSNPPKFPLMSPLYLIKTRRTCSFISFTKFNDKKRKQIAYFDHQNLM